MSEAVTLSYAGALILLYICILIFSGISPKKEVLVRRLIVGIGMVPGLIGVIYGFSLAFTELDTRKALAIIMAWLILEVGALQLTMLIKNKSLGPKNNSIGVSKVK